jgi:hypothetical protein
MAKLLLPSGTLLHENCGETLSPTQFGFVAILVLLLAVFFGMILPSAKVVDLSVKTSAASAAGATQPSANVAVATAKMRFVIMTFPLWRSFDVFRRGVLRCDLTITPMRGGKFR